MLIARIFVTRAEMEVRRLAPVTSGMVGAEVEVLFDRTWDGYAKTFVWNHNGVTKDDLTASGKIPAEVLEKSGGMLKFGVYGTKEGKALPTIWGTVGTVHAGADPSGDESTDPSLPVWAQLQEDVEQLAENVNGAVKAVNGVEPDENGNVQIEASPDDVKQLEMLIEADMLPAACDASGAILTDENGNIILRY